MSRDGAIRLLPFAGAALAAALLLGGCSAGGATGGATGGGDSGTGASTAPSDSSNDGTAGDGTAGDGTTGADGSDIGNDAGHTEIPSTYPRDDVPLIDDDPVFAVDLGTGWSIMLPTDDRDADLAEVDGILLGKGFTTDFTTGDATGTFTQYSDAKYTVQITGTDDSEFGEVIHYVVILN